MDNIDETNKPLNRPGDRLGDKFTPGKQGEFQEARNRPEKPIVLEAAPPTEANRGELKPAGAGLQVGPSPGGGNYINTRAHKPQPTNQAENKPQSQTQAPSRPSLFEAAQQRLNEVRAAKTLSRESLEATRPVVRLADKIGIER